MSSIPSQAQGRGATLPIDTETSSPRLSSPYPSAHGVGAPASLTFALPSIRRKPPKKQTCKRVRSAFPLSPGHTIVANNRAHRRRAKRKALENTKEKLSPSSTDKKTLDLDQFDFSLGRQDKTGGEIREKTGEKTEQTPWPKLFRDCELDAALDTQLLTLIQDKIYDISQPEKRAHVSSLSIGQIPTSGLLKNNSERLKQAQLRTLVPITPTRPSAQAPDTTFCGGVAIDELKGKFIPSISLCLFQKGYAIGAWKSPYGNQVRPYDHHSNEMLTYMNRGEIPPSFHCFPPQLGEFYIDGCLYVEVKDFRESPPERTYKGQLAYTPRIRYILLRPNAASIRDDVLDLAAKHKLNPAALEARMIRALNPSLVLDPDPRVFQVLQKVRRNRIGTECTAALGGSGGLLYPDSYEQCVDDADAHERLTWLRAADLDEAAWGLGSEDVGGQREWDPALSIDSHLPRAYEKSSSPYWDKDVRTSKRGNLGCLSSTNGKLLEGLRRQKELQGQLEMHQQEHPNIMDFRYKGRSKTRWLPSSTLPGMNTETTKAADGATSVPSILKGSEVNQISELNSGRRKQGQKREKGMGGKGKTDEASQPKTEMQKPIEDSAPSTGEDTAEVIDKEQAEWWSVLLPQPDLARDKEYRVGQERAFVFEPTPPEVGGIKTSKEEEGGTVRPAVRKKAGLPCPNFLRTASFVTHTRRARYCQAVSKSVAHLLHKKLLTFDYKGNLVEVDKSWLMDSKELQVRLSSLFSLLT